MEKKKDRRQEMLEDGGGYNFRSGVPSRCLSKDLEEVKEYALLHLGKEYSRQKESKCREREREMQRCVRVCRGKGNEPGGLRWQ